MKLNTVKPRNTDWRNVYELRPVVLISACLAQVPVRFSGDTASNKHVKRILPGVDLVPVCPEMSIGLGTPRPTLRLVKHADDIRLIQPDGQVDRTDAMHAFSNSVVAGFDVDGILLKAYSPTCGPRGVKVYNEAGTGLHPVTTAGVFAKLLLQAQPDVATEDEGRLNDASLRQAFLIRIYASARWRAFRETAKRLADLQEFHAANKILYYAFHPDVLREMGDIAAGHGSCNLDSCLEDYAAAYFRLLASMPTRGRWVNALQHASGFVSRSITPAQRQQVSQTISAFADALVPLSVPVFQLRALAEANCSGYLSKQTFWEPWPLALAQPDSSVAT